MLPIRPIPSSTDVLPPDAPKSHSSVGPIIGGVIGGTFLVLLLSVAILVVRHRRRQRMKMQEIREETEQLARSMNPFPPPFPAIGIDFDTILIVEAKLTTYKYR